MPSLGDAAAPSAVGWTRAALWLTHVGVVAAVSMQAVKGDWFPPENSMSQYGVGRYGWVFTVCVAALGLAGLAMAVGTLRTTTAMRRTTAILLIVWGGPLLLTGVVPADATAAHPSAAGVTHMYLSAVALLALPMAGFLTALSGRPTARPVRLTLLVLCVLSELSLVLLLLAANGVDVSGLGSRAAWSLYQSISVVLDVAILYLVRLGLAPHRGVRPLAAVAQ